MEKGNRPIRNRRHSKRAWPPGDIHRPIKRLFTPEIKRMLKEWLVRRRENPYPSRDEKKALAHKTGLTYTQICNWFANWRRKLKNAGKEPQKRTWGHLIKNYNTNANGNVEQFSICSSDSIWGEEEQLDRFDPDHHREYDYHLNVPYDNYKYGTTTNLGPMDRLSLKNPNSKYYFSSTHYTINPPPNDGYYIDNIPYCISTMKKPMPLIAQEQCFQISSTTNNLNNSINNPNSGSNFIGNTVQPSNSIGPNAKYKNHIMEKYLRGLDDTGNVDGLTNNKTKSSPKVPELSKWLESAANFTPDKSNYIEWDNNRNKVKHVNYRPFNSLTHYGHDLYSSTEQKSLATDLSMIHQKEELDAAEALTSLAGNYRNRMINMNNNYVDTE